MRRAESESTVIYCLRNRPLFDLKSGFHIRMNQFLVNVVVTIAVFLRLLVYEHEHVDTRM